MIALLVAATLVAGFAAVLGQGLLSRDGSVTPGPAARPLSAAEADRLAGMRQRNWRDARAGVRASIGTGADQLWLAGWVDWRRPMVYLAATSSGRAGAEPQLLQAVPGLVATRPATAAVAGPDPWPPVDPPAGGWRVRSPGTAGPPGAPADPGTLDALAVLLLTITASELDAPQLLAGSEARWLRADRVAGHRVDVLLGPAVPPSQPPPGPTVPGRAPDLSLAGMGGAVQYWLDHQARLHRLATMLATGTPAHVELDRTDPTAPAVLDLLGGAAIDPRPVTSPERAALAELRQRNQATRGGQLTLVVPTADGTVRGAGWLDWHRSVAYLARTRDGAPAGLLWADRAGVATRPGEPAAGGGPPVPAPAGRQWRRTPWQERGDEQGGFDLDLLLHEALALAGEEAAGGPLPAADARWLRRDRVGGVQVDVYELPRPVESEVEPGGARLRYWVDRQSGVLLRLEIRTRTGGFGQLDLDPGPVPYLG
jgi:hypothetical protein